MVQTNLIEIPDGTTVGFDVDAFDEQINAHGVQLVHYIAVQCPVGMVDIGDGRRPHSDHSGCSNGFLYGRAGTVRALFTSNSKRPVEEVGFLDSSMANLTISRYYEKADDQEPSRLVYVTKFDRFFLQEEYITIPHWGIFFYNESGINKLNFPVEEVIVAVDSNQVKFEAGTDFVIENRNIRWLPNGKNPGIDPVTKRGRVFSVRYTYRPYWYVRDLRHEVRVARNYNEFTGEQMTRMPQSLVVQREFAFENSQNDPEAPPEAKERQVQPPRPVPSLPRFGPR